MIDDDPLVGQSLSHVLRADGHDVTVADGGQAGIDAFTAAHRGLEAFDVVITDLGMPYVDGRAVAAAVKALSPRTPVLLLTGWGQRLTTEQSVPPTRRSRIEQTAEAAGAATNALRSARCCGERLRAARPEPKLH